MPKISIESFDLGVPNEPPVGLAYLSGMLKKNSIDFKAIDMRLGYSVGDIKDIIADYKPTVVGISYWSLERSKTQALIKKIKEIVDIPVVIGGPHVSSVRQESLRETEADYAIKGEGEFTLIELLEFLKGNISGPEEIKGLIFKRDGAVTENADREPITDLDSLPFPAYEDFEIDRYARRKRINIASSRGCPYNCNYCAVRLTMGRNFRPRSPKNVFDELIHWKNLGYEEFEFIDDCFTFDMKRSEEICDLIIKADLKISWFLGNGTRADRVSESLLLKMKQSGCKIIMFGVESGNNDILARMGKGIKVSQAESAVRLAKKAGIEYVGATFIIGHPGENLNMIREYIKKVENWPVDKINFYNLVPYPGTEVFDWIRKNSIFLDKDEKYLDRLSYYSGFPIFETDDFPCKDRIKALKLGKRLSNRVATKYFTGLFTKRYGLVIGFLAGRLINFKKLMVVLSGLGVNKFVKRNLKNNIKKG
jgi:radical SAM superfamily enzyme YgiQ (UPF0313 family)